MSIEVNNVLQHYEKVWHTCFEQEPSSWLSMLRRQQLDDFLSPGFPSTRDENWKYTNLTSLAKHFFQLATNKQIKNNEQFDRLQLSNDAYRLVFIDGHFQKQLSQLNAAFTVCDLASALYQHKDILQSFVTKPFSGSGFVNLNTACLQDGAFIHLPENCQLEKPVHLLYLSTADNLQTIRNIIFVAPNSHLALFEEHISVSEQTYLANSVTQIEAGQNSKIEYVKLQKQNVNSFHIANTQINQQKDSAVTMHLYSLGSHIARDDIINSLLGPNASFNLQGLYLPFKKQHIDVHTSIHHLADHTASEESFRGVVAGQSRAVFNGKICVGEKIKKAVANLQNKNLLLAPNAEVNTKPELEIYADDVKCKHGATIGQIDKEMLFYLRSRGIAEQEAYHLLLLAFIREQLSMLANQPLGEKLLDVVSNHCEEVMR